jgi:hypothetical protein
MAQWQTLRQAIASFMFDRDKGSAFEKLKKIHMLICRTVGGMVEVTENDFRQTLLVGSKSDDRCIVIFVLGEKKRGDVCVMTSSWMVVPMPDFFESTCRLPRRRTLR